MKSKAIFLLVIFLLNTLIGFGCALGMEGEAHVHKGHDHNNHNHDHATAHEHENTPVSGLKFSQVDPCCKTLVNDLVTQSKLVPESGKVIVLPLMCLPVYVYNLFVPSAGIEREQHAWVIQKERPPNPDIRIMIQSFQL